eukprot:m.126628 g.126628  ORF g.126628 m.126628 type:complete len:141 (-) comp13838_c0_seq3:1552-1974(-)
MCLTVVVGLIAVGIGFLSYWSLKPHITDTSHTSDMAGQVRLLRASGLLGSAMQRAHGSVLSRASPTNHTFLAMFTSVPCPTLSSPCRLMHQERLAESDREDLVKTASSIFEFTVDGLDGQQVPLSDFKGKVTLIVNTASG